jgi:hypothetical protein
VKCFEDESRKLVRANSNWKEFARLLNRNDRMTGNYCIQCNVISHDKHRCSLANQDEVCEKCIRLGCASSKLIELDGVLYLGWLPLPAEARGDARGQDAPYWIPHQEVV